MSESNKQKHLDFTQLTITRMAANSFLLKAWSVTLVAGIFALSDKKTSPRFFLIAFLPVAIFWGLDAYYLLQERLFRDVYNKVAQKTEKQIDFDMSPKEFIGGKNTWLTSFWSVSLWPFYLTLGTVTAIVGLAVN